MIGFDRPPPWLGSLRGLPFQPAREMFAFRFDNDLAQLAAIRAGCGIGVCQVAIARRDTALVRVLDSAFAFDLEAWLAMHEDLRPLRRMRLVFDHLVQALLAYVAEGSASGVRTAT